MPQVHRESGFRFSTRYSRYYKENYGPGLLLDIPGTYIELWIRFSTRYSRDAWRIRV